MEDSVKYKGFNIKIIHDESPLNPFTDWDGQDNLMYISRQGKEDYSKEGIADYISDFASDGQIIRHQKKIIQLFEIDDSEVESFQEEAKSNKVFSIRSCIRTAINDNIDCDFFKNMEEYCDLIKLPCLTETSRGYSQGDWAVIFTCPTDKVLKDTGATEIDQKWLRATADLFSNYAWGNVYGYQIEELEDSCWGYFGRDHEKSGLLDAARDIIDYQVEQTKKKRFKRLKELIKSKVSLLYRHKELSQYTLA